MSQATTPLWQTVLSILGFSSLIGAVFAHWLSSRRERSRWINESKKAEWRELIDRLDQSLEAMSYAFVRMNVSTPDGSNNPELGIRRGKRVIHDRIFIADAIKKHALIEKWEEVVKYISDVGNPRSPSQRGAPTLVGFDAKRCQFQEEVLSAARKDLGL